MTLPSTMRRAKNGSQKVSAYIRKGTFYMNLNEQDLKKSQILTCHVENAGMDIRKRNK